MKIKNKSKISKFYERLPNPVLIAMNEYNEGDLHYRYGREDRDNRDNNRGGGGYRENNKRY